MEYRRESIFELFGVSDCLIKSCVKVEFFNSLDLNVDAWQTNQIGNLPEDETASLDVITVLAEESCQFPFSGSSLPLLTRAHVKTEVRSLWPPAR